MKKSYGYIPRIRVTNGTARGQASSSRHSIRSSNATQFATASVIPTNSPPTLSVDDLDRQLIRFFKAHE